MKAIAARTLAGVVPALLLAGCASGPVVGVIPEHPDLSGTWLFNAEASEEPDDEPPAPPGPGGREPGVSRTRTPLTASILPSVAFRIEEEDSALVFIDAQGRRRTIYQDGRPFQLPVEGLGNLRVQAWWQGEEFVVRKRMESGPTITETYELQNEGRRLRVEVRIVAGRRTEFTRVYDRTNSP